MNELVKTFTELGIQTSIIIVTIIGISKIFKWFMEQIEVKDNFICSYLGSIKDKLDVIEKDIKEVKDLMYKK